MLNYFFNKEKEETKDEPTQRVKDKRTTWSVDSDGALCINPNSNSSSESEDDSFSEEEEELPTFKVCENNPVYLINIDDETYFYVKTENEAKTVLREIAYKLRGVSPLWKKYIVHLKENRIHIERETDWGFISYPDVIHRLSYSAVNNLVRK